MAELSDYQATFLDTIIHKGDHFRDQGILDIKTHFKPTKKFQYMHFKSNRPSNVKKGFVQGEAFRFLRTYSLKNTFDSNLKDFKECLNNRG